MDGGSARRTVRSVSRLLLVLPLLAAGPALSAQQPDLRIETPGDAFVDPDFTLRLRIQGELSEGERVALLVGPEDVSALLVRVQGGYEYRPGVLGLPGGTSRVTAYHVDATGRWTEAARAELRVRRTLGFEVFRPKPGLTLNFSAQPADGERPAPDEEVDVPEILDGRFDLEALVEHRQFDFTLSGELIGTSEQDRALRFRELEDEAPLLDLSSYRLDHLQGPVELSLGHIRTGNSRHLISSFGSRGAGLTVAPSDRVDFSVAANAGRQQVGWSNLLGVGDADHRVLSANVGVEALEQPGALRVEVGWMDGSILPRNNFNQGAINDAESSNGLSVRLAAQGLERRLRVDASWTQSTFDNPEDPTLNQGLEVVDVVEETREARYLQAELDILRGLRIGDSKTARLSVGFQHERVDPLFRSVAASSRADFLQDQLSLRADVAGVGLQGSFSSAEDNLDEVPSVLKSNTDRRTLSLSIPLARMAEPSWLPSLTYRNDRTHQFGEALPENGGFSPGHVPDQVSVNQSFTTDFRLGPVSLRYQLNHSEQDNRQEGREDADFETLGSGFGVGIDPTRTLRLAFDLELDRSDDLGADERDNTRRWGANASWRPFQSSTLTLRFSDTFKDDEARTREQTGRTIDAKWSSRVPGLAPFEGSWHLRFSRTESGRIDRPRDLTTDRSRWAVTLGASLGISRR